jgi:hypothetical protein
MSGYAKAAAIVCQPIIVRNSIRAPEVGNLDSPVVACHRLVTFLFCTAVIGMMDDPTGRTTWRPRSRGAAF